MAGEDKNGKKGVTPCLWQAALLWASEEPAKTTHYSCSPRNYWQPAVGWPCPAANYNTDTQQLASLLPLVGRAKARRLAGHNKNSL